MRRSIVFLSVLMVAQTAAVPVSASEPTVLSLAELPDAAGQLVDRDVSSALPLAQVSVASDRAPLPIYEGNPESEKPGLTPATRSAEVKVDGGDVAIVGTPITLHAPKDAFAADANATVTVFDREVADDLSPVGVFFDIDFGDSRDGAAGGKDAIEVTLDYSDVGLTSGAMFADRMVIYRVDGCSDRERKTEEDDEVILEHACDVWTPLEIVDNDVVNRTIRFRLDTRTAESITSPGAGFSSRLEFPVHRTLRFSSHEGGGYVGSGGPASQHGDFGATPFALPSWSVGLFSGSAETSYPIPVPPAAAGITPSVTLSYSSGSVDGMNTAANTQPGPIGAGWSLSSASIMWELESCSTGLCDVGDHYMISMNGVSSRLVANGTDNYLLQSDPRWRVVMHRNAAANHPDSADRYWIVTTPDGTQYRFGYDDDRDDKSDSNSVTWVPIDSSECPGASPCELAMTWHLDQVTDTNGNEIHYRWEQEHNYYDDPASSTNIRYIRATHLREILYTLGSQGQANARIWFNHELRCGDASSTFGDCTWPDDFLDTPGDLWCKTSTATLNCTTAVPTFWTQLRLGSIHTQVWNATAGDWATTGLHDLAQNLPNPPADPTGDLSDQKLLLYRMHQRPGGTYNYYAYAQIEAEDYHTQSGTSAWGAVDVGFSEARGMSAGDYLKFDDMWFGGETPGEVVLRVSNNTSSTGTLEVRKGGPDGAIIASINVAPTGTSEDFINATVTTLSNLPADMEDIFVVAQGGNGTWARVNWLRFKPVNADDIESLPAVDYWSGAWEWLPNRRNHPAGQSAMYVGRINEFENQLGGVVDFAYAQPQICPSTQTTWSDNHTDCFPGYDAYEAGGWVAWNKHKVTAVTLSDAFSGNDSETYTYAYANPSWHYTQNPVTAYTSWDEFRGHSKVIVTDAAGHLTEHYFYQGMDRDKLNGSGGEKDVDVTGAGGLASEDHNWLTGQPLEVLRRHTGGWDVWSRHWYDWTLNAGGAPYGAYFTGVDRIDTTVYGTTNRTSRVEYVYGDDYGNITEELHRGSTATSTDNRYIEREFTTPNTTAWIVSLPQKEKLWAGNGPGAADEEVALTRWAYDQEGDTTPNFAAQPTRGNVTLERRYITRDPSDVWADTLFYYHDGDAMEQDNGWLGAVVDPNGNATITNYATTTGYVTSVDPPLIGATTTTYDGRGRITSVSDANGNTTWVAYDDYNRTRKVWNPENPPSTTPPSEGNGTASVVYEYNLDSYPANVKTLTRIEQFGGSGGTQVDAFVYYDGFGRRIQTQTDSPDGSGRQLVSSRYDDRGLLKAQSAPYEISGAPGDGFVNPTFSALDNWERFWEYDPLGNLTELRHMNLGTTQWTTFTDVDVAITTVTDPNGNDTEYTDDAFGNLVSVKDANNQTTTYAYDVANRLTYVDDPLATAYETFIDYDMVGRKTRLDDPNMGEWFYEYDDNGNLIKQTDARDDELHFEYDGLNRVLRRATASTFAASTLVAEYTYDATGYAGLPATMTSHADYGDIAVTFASYDDNANLTRKEWSIPGTGGGTYAIAFDYDTSGILRTTTYPGGNDGSLGETVTTNLDNGTGLPDDMFGTDTYVASTTYNHAGQIVDQDFGTGTTRINRVQTYQASTLRLDSSSAGSNASTDDLFDNSFQYDDAGNITRIHDVVNSGQYMCFGYDVLHRLTSAFTGNSGCTTPNATGDGDYDHTYGYNNIGNLTSFAGQTQQFWGASGPYRIRNADGSGNDFTYDANGMMLTRNVGAYNQTLTWNPDHWLESITQGTAVTEFAYDATGQRVVKSSDDVTTIYLDQHYEREVTTTVSTPDLTWSPTALNPSAAVGGGSVQETSTLSTSDASSASFTITENASWLTVSPATGTTDQLISFTADPTGLSAGTYVETVSATATGYDQGDVVVTFTVSAQPTLDWNPASVGVSGVAGGPSVQATSVLSASDSSSASFTLAESASWLVVSPATGTTQDTITFTADPGGLTAGTYIETVSATAAGYVQGDIVVTFTVSGGGGGGALFEDDFTGTNGAGWDSAKWSTSTHGDGVVDIQADEGHLEFTTGTGAAGQAVAVMTDTTDAEVLLSVRIDPTSPQGSFRVWLRGSGDWSPGIASMPTDGYWVEINNGSGNVSIKKRVGGGQPQTVTSGSVRDVNTSAQWVRFRVDGSDLRASVWNDGDSEPSAWELSATDSSITAAGVVQVAYRRTGGNAGRHAYVDDVEVFDLGAGTGVDGGFYVSARGPAVLSSGSDTAKGLLAAFQTETVVERFYYYFAGERVGVRDDGNLSFIVGDHLGSTTVAWEPSTSTSAVQRYYPYGTVRHATGSLPTDFGFTGQRADDSTGLMYYNARYYDPHTGRFISPDSIVPDPTNPQDLNRYAYVNNNPVNFTDPSGHCGVGDPRTGEAATCANQGNGVGDLWEKIGGRVVVQAPGVRTDVTYGDVFRFAVFDYDQCSSSALGCGIEIIGIVPWAKVARLLRFADEAAGAARLGSQADNLGDATNGLSDDIIRLADGHLTGSGETVLGHYADDYIGLAQSRGASYFDIGDAWDGLSDAQRWAANQRVLDTAIANGDRITLATNRLSIRPGSALAREIDYLTGPAGSYVWLDDVTLVPGG